MQSALVVGAGIAGLTAARALRERGVAVTVLDKGRGVGGRLATRRLGESVMDHGAQFFTVRNPVFEAWVREWEAAGVVQEWCRGFADAEGRVGADGHPRYGGVGGMTTLAKHLAGGLRVQTGMRVAAIRRRSRGWVAWAEGVAYAADALVLTPPVPQTLAILDAGDVELPPDIRDALDTVAYDLCLAVLAVLDGPSGIPAPGAVQIGEEPVVWVADNQQKGISPRACGLTLHGGPEFSRYFERWDDGTIATALLAAAGKWVGAPVQTAQVQRWRYAQPIFPLPDPCLFVDGPPLVFAGDAFGGPRVEGAALSGLAAAERIAAALGV